MSIFIKNEEDSRSSNIVYLKNTIKDYSESGWTYIPGSTCSGLGRGIHQMRTATITGNDYSIDDGWVHIFDSVHHWAYNIPNKQWEWMDYNQNNNFSEDTFVSSINEDIYLYRNFDDSSTRGIYKWNKNSSNSYTKVSSIPGTNPYSKYVEFMFSLGNYLHVIVHSGRKHYKISKSDLDDTSVSVDNKNWVECGNPWSVFDDGYAYAFWKIRERCVMPSELEGVVYIISSDRCYKWIEQTDEIISIPESDFLIGGKGFYNSAALLTDGIGSSHLLHIVGGARIYSEGIDYTDDQNYYVYDKVSLSLITNNLNAHFRGDSDYGCAAVSYNGDVYIINNYDKSVYKFLTNVYESIDIYEYIDTWDELENLPLDLGNSGVAVVYNNELHILGCNNGTTHYKLTNNGWTTVSTLPIAIGEFETFVDPLEGSSFSCYTCGSIVVCDNKIHLLYHYKHYSWDPTNGWVLINNNAPIYSNSCTIVFNNEIHVLGYWYNTGGMLGSDPESEHLKYSNGQWIEIQPGTYSDEVYRLNDLSEMRGGVNANAFIYNNELYLIGDETTWDSVTRKSYRRLYKWNGNSSNSIWTLVSSAEKIVPNINRTNAQSRKSSITTKSGNIIDYFYEDYQYKFNGVTWNLANDDTPFFVKYGGSAEIFNGKTVVVQGTKSHINTTGEILSPLYGHIFNRIKGIWTKIKVPTYDEYGNCTMVEQAKRVKAVWVGGPDNKAKRVY